MFTPTEQRKNKNGTMTLIGPGPGGEKIARIVSAQQLQQYKK